MKRFTRRALTLIGAAAIVIVGGYMAISAIKSFPKLKYTYGDYSKPPQYPDAKFAVISDTHIYDTSLGTTGAAFEETLASDRKLLVESRELNDLAIERIIDGGVDFVLVTGDLTKDGERVNHELFASQLAKLKAAGVSAYVVPGNHDVYNGRAWSYDGDGVTTIPNVSDAEFAQVYADFGYNAALYRDETSLSYVAEPVAGLWLLALDSCRWRDNKPGEEETVGGAFTQETMDWMTGVLKEAQSRGIPVIAMEHHGVNEHWDGQRKLHPDYLVEDYARVGKVLRSYGVRLVFTGHYHAQDITAATYNDKTIYDVETGSLITPPCPVRFCSLSDGILTIKSETLADIYGGGGHGEEGRAFVKRMLKREVDATLAKNGVKGNDSKIIGEAVSEAFLAHYSGDEIEAQKVPVDTKQLSLWGKIVYATQKYVVTNLWIDLPPSDNNATLDLRE